MHFKSDRTLSSIILIVLLIFFLISIMMNLRIVFTPIVALVSVLATYELINVAGSKSKLLIGISCTVSGLYIFNTSYHFLDSFVEKTGTGTLLSLYVLVILALSVFDNKKIKYTDSVMAIFASTFIPYAFSCYIRLNDINSINPKLGHYEGIVLVALTFGCSWLVDSFAYLCGKRFGKHKLSPVISPKKTVEGAIGGLLVSAVIVPFVLFFFDLVGKIFWDHPIFMESPIKYLYFSIVTIVVGAVSMVGDLAASVLKRNIGVKDFSNLIKGHGGIMDRFDSCIFVLPTLYAIIRFISL